MVYTEYNNNTSLLDTKEKWMSQFVPQASPPRYLYTFPLEFEHKFIGAHVPAIFILAKRLGLRLYAHVTNQFRLKGPQILETNKQNGSIIWCVSIPPYVDPQVYFHSDYHPWKCFKRDTLQRRTIVICEDPNMKCKKLLNDFGETAKEYFYADNFIGTEQIPSPALERLDFEPNAYNTPLLVLANKLADRYDTALMQIIHSNYYGSDPLALVSSGDFAKILYHEESSIMLPSFDLEHLKELIHNKVITNTIISVNLLNGQGSSRIRVSPSKFLTIAEDLKIIMEYRRIVDEPLLQQVIPGYVYKLNNEILFSDEKIILINHKQAGDLTSLITTAMHPKRANGLASRGPPTIILQGIKFWRLNIKNLEYYPAHIFPLAANMLVAGAEIVQNEYDGPSQLQTQRGAKMLHRFSEACACNKKVVEL